MKQILFSCTILIALISLSLYSSHALSHLTDHCTSQLSYAQELAEQGNWAQARTITQETNRTWHSYNTPLYALLHHSEADNILLSFCSVEEYLKLEEIDEYAAANATLIQQLKLVSEVQQPSLVNVL